MSNKFKNFQKPNHMKLDKFILIKYQFKYKFINELKNNPQNVITNFKINLMLYLQSIKKLR